MQESKAIGAYYIRLTIMLFSSALIGLCPLFFLWGVMYGKNGEPSYLLVIAKWWVFGPPFLIFYLAAYSNRKIPKELLRSKKNLSIRHGWPFILAFLWIIGMWLLGIYCFGIFIKL